jgi:hypothetical protein
MQFDTNEINEQSLEALAESIYQNSPSNSLANIDNILN